jgi:peptidoglycan/LPS O-acetylase OafA/YrhL
VLGRYEVGAVTIHQGFALVRWFQFFMGVCVYWLVTGKTSWIPLVATWAFLAVVLVVDRGSFQEMTPIIVSGLLWWSYRRDRMQSFLSNAPVQFLGRISYSLYLFHATIGWRWIRAVGSLIGSDVGLPVVLAVFGSGCVVAVLAAWAAHRLIEQPSMALSRVVALRTSPDTTPAAVPTSPALPPEPASPLG